MSLTDSDIRAVLGRRSNRIRPARADVNASATLDFEAFESVFCAGFLVWFLAYVTIRIIWF